MSKPKLQFHTIPPFVTAKSNILVLGSFPSVKSRQLNFYYGHPQNRFWRVLSSIFEKETPQTIEQKQALLTDCNVALWDIIASCEIAGSSDSSIKNVTPNDIASIIRETKVKKIITNGKLAHKLYEQYILKQTEIEDICLPSTSPANASYSLEKLVQIWGCTLDEIGMKK